MSNRAKRIVERVQSFTDDFAWCHEMGRIVHEVAKGHVKRWTTAYLLRELRADPRERASVTQWARLGRYH